MKKQVILLLLLACSLCSVSSVYGIRYDLITELGTSAEMIGKGNIAGFGDGANVVFENPAALTNVSHTSLSLFTTQVMGEANYLSLALSTETSFGKIGFGYMETAVFDFPDTYRDSTLIEDNIFVSSYFDYRDSIYKLSWQDDLSTQWSLGSSLTYYSKAFSNYSASGYDMDLGLLGRFHKYELSLVAVNILPNRTVEYTEGDESIPFQFISGARYYYSDFSFMAQWKYFNQTGLVSYGMTYQPPFLPLLHLSAGYKQFLTVGDLVKQNMTIGLGLHLAGVSFNYAFEKSEHYEFDNKSYFSLNMNF